ncbi:MAG: hypothetical protein IMF19_04585 [Proteobacteria bacterium]|nr:hypothetical protein [Pseudomonadota bacterium]
MASSELSIHLMEGKAPRIIVTEHSNFSVIEVCSSSTQKIKFFLYSKQKVVNFKNNLLWAFENPMKIE